MKKNSTDILYKYFHDGRTDVLENGMIRYTQPKEFNDPFEALPYIKAVADDKAIHESAEKMWDKDDIFYETLEKRLSENPQIQSLPQQHQKLLRTLAARKMEQLIPRFKPFAKNLFTNSMSLKGPPKKIMHQTIVGAINDAIGILCLTETHENLLMWSHYSNSHKGFVVGFDRRHEYFNQTKEKIGLAGFVKKVRYTDERPEVTFFDSNLSKEENLDNWVRNFIWVKSEEWKYEDEWRMVNTLRDADSKIEINGTKIFLFNFPLDTISSIYLGCKMETEVKKKIISLVSDISLMENVEIYESQIHERKYKLTFNKIN